MQTSKVENQKKYRKQLILITKRPIKIVNIWYMYICKSVMIVLIIVLIRSSIPSPNTTFLICWALKIQEKFKNNSSIFPQKYREDYESPRYAKNYLLLQFVFSALYIFADPRRILIISVFRHQAVIAQIIRQFQNYAATFKIRLPLRRYSLISPKRAENITRDRAISGSAAI